MDRGIQHHYCGMAVWSSIFSASAQRIFICLIHHQRNPVLQDRLNNSLLLHTPLPGSLTFGFVGQYFSWQETSEKPRKSSVRLQVLQMHSRKWQTPCLNFTCDIKDFLEIYCLGKLPFLLRMSMSKSFGLLCFLL